MSIKDDLNKGFTVGDVTTTNFDDEAKIKVKDFYELDRLERAKTLELAGRVDIELVKRDAEIESMSENVTNLGSDVVEVKKDITDIDGRVTEIENNGTGGGGSSKGYYTLLDSMSDAYIFYKFEVPQEDLDSLGELTLDKYNSLSLSDQTTIKNLLAKAEVSDPTDLESIKNELSNPYTKIGSMILKVYGTSVRIPINKEFTFIIPDKIGLTKKAVSSKILDIVLSKRPNGQYDSTHSTAIGSITNSKVMSIYAAGEMPSQDVGADTVYLINYLEAGVPTNKFGIRVAGGYSSSYDTPYSITGDKIEKISRLDFNTVNNFIGSPTTETITVSDTEYGDVSKFTTRTVRIGAQGKYLTYDILVRYNANGTTANIVENLPLAYMPYYNSPWAKGLDFNFYGSDGSITKGELIGASRAGETGRIVHSGTLLSGVTYTAKLQVRGAFQ